MKRIVLLILALILLLLSACSVSDPPEIDIPSAGDGVEEHESMDSSQTDSQNPLESENSETISSEPAEPSDRDETGEKSENSAASQEPGNDPFPEPQTSSSPSETSSQTQTQPPVPEPPKPSSTPESEPEEPTPPAEPVQPQEPNAGASDAQAVADAVLAYINQYRAEQGSSAAVKLPGLTEYARYRSEQLMSNFSHNTDDERAAATALQYGEYIDPVLFGITGDPYYTVNAREAIAKAGYTGTVDDVARSLSQLVKNSAGHWSYVGASEYGYIAVGVTYRSGMWYCDISMARENTDG